ncbi:MAG: signal peptidase II [Eubacteriales bacterium]|nr:signal peptidase II [Eubacteriales bacterium]
MLYAIFAVLVIILDQGVKYWVSGAIHMESAGETFIPGILSIINVHNDGAAFSFLSGSNARIYFIILTGVFTVLVIIALATKFISGPLARWSIVMVTAGGISNCIDRVIYGYVQDMFKCEFVNFPVFNVADIFITVFALLFVIAIIFERDHRRDFRFDDDEDIYEDEEEDEEEEEEPRRPSRKEKRVSRRKSRDEEVEDEEETPAPAPARSRRVAAEKAAPAPEAARKAHTSKYDAEYEQFKARRAAAAAAQAAEPVSAPVSTPAPAPAPQPAAKPAAPAPKPFRADTDSEFSLDDILAEFK